MSIFGIIGWVAVVLLALFVSGLAVTFIRDYGQATGSPWARVLAASRGSATWFTVKMLAIGSSLLAMITWVAELLGQQEVITKLKDAVPPEYWGGISLGITVLVAWSRLRTLNK